MSEISREYIDSITKEELEAAGYRFRKIAQPSPFVDWIFAVSPENRDLGNHHDIEVACEIAREHYAPRKLLAEVQARIAALEALVREAHEHTSISEMPTPGGTSTVALFMPDGQWLDRAAKLLGDLK